jgi:hypothetical protein
MSDLAKLDPEAEILARRVAQAFKGMVSYYSRPAEAGGHGMTPADAEEKAHEPWPDAKERVLRGEPDQVSWWQLGLVAEDDPEAALAGWERIKQAARDELSTGHRAAAAVVLNWEDPWERARFLALRSAFLEEWGPVGGMENVLVETLAHAYSCYLDWLETLASYTKLNLRDSAKDDRWQPPRVERAEAVEQAAAMVDRFNRIMLRTLRALRDLRRYAPAVTIQQAGQVNVGGRQLNVAMDGPEDG